MDGAAQAEFCFRQDFPPEGVQGDVLGGGEEGQQGRKARNQQDFLAGVEASQGADGKQQPDLGQQHPAAPPPQGKDETIQEGRPDEFPGEGKLDQGKETDGFQIHSFAAQPGGDQIDEQIQGQAGGKARKNADQHLAGQQGGKPGRCGHEQQGQERVRIIRCE